MNKLILVTGGTGYIGSHTVVELMNEGFDVVIIDNLSNSEKSVLDGIAEITGRRPFFEQFDICDKKRLHDFSEYTKDWTQLSISPHLKLLENRSKNH